MLARDIALFLRIPLQEREMVDPHETEVVALEQVQPARKLQAEVGERLVNDRRRSCDKEQQVARFRLEGVDEQFLRSFGEELDDVRLQSRVRHPHPGHASGAEPGGIGAQVVDLAAGERATALGVDTPDEAPFADDALEDLEFSRLGNRGQVANLKSEAGVRPVGAEPRDRLGVLDAGDRIGDVDVQDLFEQVPREAFRQPHDVGDEGHLDIWVNSGWRSPRRSSSLKQRTIWK